MQNHGLLDGLLDFRGFKSCQGKCRITDFLDGLLDCADIRRPKKKPCPRIKAESRIV